MNTQRGGTLLGFIIGALVGLGAALAVAIYITKVRSEERRVGKECRL